MRTEADDEDKKADEREPDGLARWRRFSNGSSEKMRGEPTQTAHEEALRKGPNVSK